MTHPAEPADALYRRIVENSQGLICVHDLSGVLLYTNPASAAELGYSVEELIGRNGTQLLAPPVRPLFREYLERIRANQSDQGVLRLKRRDGTERLWAYRNVLHQPATGEPYVIGHAVDITEHWRTEQQLREERLLRDQAKDEALREAMAKLKILGGLLPICASCKKIRDQDGTWQQLEAYIHAHSQAQFSHGLCPNCLDRLYPADPG